MAREQSGIKLHMAMWGVRHAMKQLGKLRESAQRKVLRSALPKASTIVIRATRPLVPKQTGVLRRSLKYSIRTPRKHGGSVMYSIIGSARPARHWHLLELGTKERFTKAGVSRGRMTAQRMLERGWAHSRMAAMRTLKMGIGTSMQKEIRRLRSKGPGKRK